MSDDIYDPHEKFKEIDVSDEEVGFTEGDMKEVLDSVRGDTFKHSGMECRVRKDEIERGKSSIETTEETIRLSQQEFWIAGVKTDWGKEMMLKASHIFESDIWTADEMDGWIESVVGHERTVSREEAEDEAEWLAEQIVMFEDGSDSPV